VPSHFWRYISEEQLAKIVAQSGYAGARAALERARIIKKGGHHPAIFHHRLDGFMVLDADDPIQKKRIDELRQ
jgi:hypothetical protein